MVTCKDCEFGGSCVLLHKSDSQVCNIFTHKKDYVEVVRCKDCKWWENGKDYTPYCNHESGLNDDVTGDYFCSYGERKDNETKTD